MGVTTEYEHWLDHEGREQGGIAVVTMDYPPVNALPVAGWFAVADAVTAAGRDDRTRVVILRAVGRGYNAGVDIKEMQNSDGFDAVLGANSGCAAAFAAVYDCPVPVIAEVAGFCVGGGIGLVGNADTVIASDDAYFGLPEIDRGALGAATHLSRLVPQHYMRTMYFTSRNVSAQQLKDFGSVWDVVPREKLHDRAMEVASEIAAKNPYVVRAAKAALNGIDPVDVKRSYRYEQGFTFEVNLAGAGAEERAKFAKKDAKPEKGE